MSEKTWLETRKKKSRRYVIVFLVFAVAAAAIFIRNNRELFLSKSGVAKQEAVISISDVPKVMPKNVQKDSAPAVLTGTVAPGVTALEKAAPDVQKQNNNTSPAAPAMAPMAASVLLPDIKCAVRDRGALKVVLSLELFIADDSFKREILLKRENLKVMVQKVLSTKTLDELIVDSLRSQTKTAMNKLLEKSMITDVEFRDFRIDKVK
jgi:flagellar basal body-associated protein FliL